MVATPPAHWGLAARGAAVEPGGPEPGFRLIHRHEVWTDRAASLYAQAAADQWDPATAIDWTLPVEHGPEVEAAVVQVMTFLVENEEAALVVPARFLGQIHPTSGKCSKCWRSRWPTKPAILRSSPGGPR